MNHRYVYTKRFSDIKTPSIVGSKSLGTGNYGSHSGIAKYTVQRDHSTSKPKSFASALTSAKNNTIEYVKSVDAKFVITSTTYDPNESKDFCLKDANIVKSINNPPVNGPNWEVR